MALAKIVLFQFLILAAAHLMLAENEVSGIFDFLNHHGDGDGGSDPENPANHSAGDPDEHQGRHFFSSLFGSLTTCNSTSQAGKTCLGCNTALNCLNGNVGFVKNCWGLFRYCNNGACSLFPGSDCSSTNSTTG